MHDPAETSPDTTASDAPQPLEPLAALRQLRILWAALLLSNVFFAGILAGAGMSWQASEEASESPITLFAAIFLTLAMLTALPIAFWVRMQCYKRHWVENRVLPRGYLTGNIILLAMLDLLAIVSLIACVLSGRWFPMVAVALLALALHLLNFPHGKPMEPAATRTAGP